MSSCDISLILALSTESHQINKCVANSETARSCDLLFVSTIESFEKHTVNGTHLVSEDGLESTLTLASVCQEEMRQTGLIWVQKLTNHFAT